MQSYDFFSYYKHPYYGFYYQNRRFTTFILRNDSDESSKSTTTITDFHSSNGCVAYVLERKWSKVAYVLERFSAKVAYVLEKSVMSTRHTSCKTNHCIKELWLKNPIQLVTNSSQGRHTTSSLFVHIWVCRECDKYVTSWNVGISTICLYISRFSHKV